MAEEIINRVANSPLKSLDLDEILVEPRILEFDLAEYLFQGLVLKEKEFRSALKDLDLEKYKDQVVSLYCSSEAIIPIWAFMLVSSKLSGVARKVYSLDPASSLMQYRLDQIQEIDISSYKDAKVVVKGCAEVPDKERLYSLLTWRLTPVVQSLMYGEPCSTVPVFKKARK